MRVLVTGGAGFIGSHVVDELLVGGHEVVVVDSLHPCAHHAVPQNLDPRAEYHWIDLTDRDAIAALVGEVDAVSHQAAMVGLGLDFGDVESLRARQRPRNRVAAARAPPDAASQAASCSPAAWSCTAMDGTDATNTAKPSRGPATGRDSPNACGSRLCAACDRELEPRAVPEDAPLRPNNVYAATKLHQEHLCELFGRDHDVPVIALRYHNVYGPRMPRDTPYAGVASIFRSALEAGRLPVVLEDGAQRRDFVHVRDVAHANRLALESHDPWSGPLNIASGHPRTVLELATAMVQSLRTRR